MRKMGLSTVVSVVLVLLCSAALYAQSTFTNPATITINDDDIATPYPSNITVSGMGSIISPTSSAVKVTLNGVSHTFPDDIGLLLVGPTGAAFLLQDGAGDTTDLVNVTYTISDAGTTQLPNTGGWGPGTYRPAAYYASPLNAVFPAPGPGTTYNSPPTLGASTLQSTFSGTNPNGVWKLYVVDSTAGDQGTIAGGWSLTITTTVSAADATVAGYVLAPDGRGLTGAFVQMTDARGVTRIATTGRRGSFQFTEVETGETYLLRVKSRLYRYAPFVVQVNDSVTGIQLIPDR